MSAAAFRAEPGGDGDRLDQRRLATSVLADEERDARIERELIELANGWDREGILVEVGDLRAFQRDCTDQRTVSGRCLTLAPSTHEPRSLPVLSSVPTSRRWIDGATRIGRSYLAIARDRAGVTWGSSTRT